MISEKTVSNMIGSWARDCETSDTIMESVHKLREADIENLQADRSFISKWVDIEVIKGIEGSGEKDEYEYHVKPCKKIIISHGGSYSLVFSMNKDGESPFVPEDFLESPDTYLKKIMHDPDRWAAFTKDVQFRNPIGYSVGYLLYDMYTISDQDGDRDPLKDVSELLGKMFKIMKEYKVEELNSFLLEHQIGRDDNTGELQISSETFGEGVLFDITLVPQR